MVYAAFALGSPWVAVSTMGIALTAPMVVVATLLPRWLPAARQNEPEPAPNHDFGAEVSGGDSVGPGASPAAAGRGSSSQR